MMSAPDLALDLAAIGKDVAAAAAPCARIHPLRQLVLRDHLFVDHCDDPID